MIIEITQDVLTEHLPFTRDVRGSKIFDSYRSALAVADNHLMWGMLGRNLYKSLADAFAAETLPANNPLEDGACREPATLDEIRKEIERYLCNYAAYSTVGRHDLVQTTSGFGTVSGQQEAIASSVRTEALKAECKEAYTLAWENLLLMLVSNDYTADDARKSVRWQVLTNTMVWKRSDLMGVDDTMTDYENRLARAASSIRDMISYKEYDRIIDDMRSGTVSAATNQVIDLCRQLMAMIITRKDSRECNRLMGDIYRIMEANTEEFAAYVASDIYAGRHGEGYENKKNSPAYWL